jgi:hypothetical protein
VNAASHKGAAQADARGLAEVIAQGSPQDLAAPETDQSDTAQPTRPTPERGADRPASPVARVCRALAWYTAEFFGDNAYEKYLARHRLVHSGRPAQPSPLTRREFYRRQTELERANGDQPACGCC